MTALTPYLHCLSPKVVQKVERLLLNVRRYREFVPQILANSEFMTAVGTYLPSLFERLNSPVGMIAFTVQQLKEFNAESLPADQRNMIGRMVHYCQKEAHYAGLLAGSGKISLVLDLLSGKKGMVSADADFRSMAIELLLTVMEKSVLGREILAQKLTLCMRFPELQREESQSRIRNAFSDSALAAAKRIAPPALQMQEGMEKR